MYNAAFEHLGLDFSYASFEVSDLAAALRAMQVLGIRGYSVSRPFKEAVIPHLHGLEPTARAIGAVNVVENRDGTLVGHNSDWIGAVRAIESCTSVTGKRAVVLGSGGAARAAAFGLKAHGAQVFLHNRNTDRTKTASEDLGVSFGGGLRDWAGIRDADIVVNATPVGGRALSDDELLPAGVLRSGQIVLEMVFDPVRTDLVRKAESAGCKVATARDMLVYQGAAAFEIFTGLPAPIEVMSNALAARPI